MTTVVYGATLAPAVRRMVERVEGRLRDRGLLGPGSDVSLLAGADDPGLAPRAGAGPRVVIPALGGRAPAPWAAALLSSAAAVLLFDPLEARALGGIAAPVVVAGLPAPPAAAAAQGLDTGPAPERILAAWRAEGTPAAAAAGVAWVGGGVLSALASAGEAWAEHRAVVTLPGTASHDMLRRGGALAARTSLEVVEATRLLLGARPLARALGDRGRHELTEWDDLETVARRAMEAVVLAGGDA